MNNETQDTSRSFIPPILCLLGSILLCLALISSAASAGTITIDTTGITGTVGQTTTVPVIVEDANSMCGYQLTIVNNNPSAADIVFNSDSVGQGFTYRDDTGIIIWSGYMQSPFQSITGTQELFKLDVTPKTAGSIDIGVTVSTTQEGSDLASASGVTPYEETGATLTVTGGSATATATATSTATATATATATSSSSGGGNGGSSGNPAVQTSKPTASSSEPTVTNTQEPAKTPTSALASPTAQTHAPSETKSPASIAGIIIGLGAAALFAARKTRR